MLGTLSRRFVWLALAFGFISIHCLPAQAAYIVGTELTVGIVDRFDGGQKSVVGSGLGQPWGVAVDPAGDIFVAETNGDRITEISPSGSRQTFYSFDSPFDNPEGLTFGPDGALYVCGTIDNPNVGSLKNVYRIDSAGHATIYASVGLQESGGLAFDADGNLYVADLYNNGSLWKVTPGKQVSLFLSGHGYIAGVAVAPDGHTLFATTWVNNNVLRITSTGQSSVYATLNAPWGIAFDTAGNLYVGESNQITKFDTANVSSVYATGLTEVRGLAAPEPSMMALLGFGAVTFVARRRRPHD